jgi:GGDEF domain-containing protein
MVTLRKFLSKEEDRNFQNDNGQKNQQDSHPGRFVRPLLAGVASTALNIDSEEHAAFQKAVNEIGDRLANLWSPESILIEVGEVVQRLGAYNQSVEGNCHAIQDELHRILSMTMETVACLSTSSCTSVQQLTVIERSLQSASSANDLKLIHNQLFACLSLVRTESARLQFESEKMIRDLKAAVLRASTHILPYVATTPPDPVTGFAGPDAVRELISRSLRDGKGLLVGVFVFDQIPAMNQHLGRKVADHVLAASARRLSAELAEFGPVLRWNGPAITLVVERSTDGEAAKAVQLGIRQLAEKALEDSITVDEKTTHFRINFSWSVWNANVNDGPEELFRKMDDFVAGRTNGNPLV